MYFRSSSPAPRKRPSPGHPVHVGTATGLCFFGGSCGACPKAAAVAKSQGIAKTALIEVLLCSQLDEWDFKCRVGRGVAWFVCKPRADRGPRWRRSLRADLLPLLPRQAVGIPVGPAIPDQVRLQWARWHVAMPIRRPQSCSSHRRRLVRPCSRRRQWVEDNRMPSQPNSEAIPDHSHPQPKGSARTQRLPGTACVPRTRLYNVRFDGDDFWAGSSLQEFDS